VTTDLQRLLDHRHHLTLDRFLAAGPSRATWDRAHRSGRLVRVHPGVSRLALIEPTPIHVVHAALLAAGEGSLLSHLSAAWLWGAEVVGHDPVDLTVLDRRRGLRLQGVRLHRPLDVRGLRPMFTQSLAVTNPMRTALDVGAVAAPTVVASVVETFVLRRYVSVGTLRRAMVAHARPGRRGLGTLRIVLDDWRLGDIPPDSVLEVTMSRLLYAHRLPPARFHHVVRTSRRSFELDFALVEHRVDIEVDGWAHHGSRRAFEADRERDAELAAAGWLVLRFTWHQVKHRASWVAERIAAAVRQRP
jgi:very-short-patch-repair endonuclease